MAEYEDTTTTHHTLMEPLDMILPLLSETENLPDDVILICPLTPPLASPPDQEQSQIWMDNLCDVTNINTSPGLTQVNGSVYRVSQKSGSKDEPFSAKTCDSVRELDPLLGSELIPTELMQRSKVETHKCSECSKVFETITDHMLTHQKRKDYHCSHPGCQKMYSSHRSLKRHCATQHGPNLLAKSSQPSSRNAKLCPYLWKSTKLPALENGASTSADHHSYFHPPKPHSVFQSEGYTDCETSYNNHTLAANLNLSQNPKDPNLSQVKLPVISQSWNLATDGTSCSLESAVDLPASHNMVTSNQWASTSYLRGILMDPVEPDSGHTLERNLDFLVTNQAQTCKEAPSDQPRTEVTDTGTGSQPSSACHRKNRPVLLKRSMVPPAPKAKAKKKRVKKILKAANFPTPPLPSPRPNTQRRTRPRLAYLVPPSQVAMASFSKESAPSDTFKGGSATAVTRNGRESGERTNLKYPLIRHARSSPLCPQGPTTSTISSTKGGKVDVAGDFYQADREVQLSPLIIPVSVPVSSRESQFNKASRHTIEKQQNVKHLSKKSHHPGLLRSLFTHNQVARGYLSQLRSPTYLADHLLYFDPPPYTPPPMLSPLRPGTGLYFNTLPKYQSCLRPPSICSASEADFSSDGKERISLTSDSTVVSIKPKINVGSRFQAEIPPLRNPLLTVYDEHPAQLVWAPLGDLPTNPETQHKVTEFLDMCCSSVLPGGGTNTELALHCLHEVRGDVLAALDLLLVRGDYRLLFPDYHYTGSDHWTAQEKRLFQKALLNKTKDFQLIHKTLHTKSVAQCVEYYYTMKKLKKFKQRRKRREDNDGGGKNAEAHRAAVEQYNEENGVRKSLNIPEGILIGHPGKNWEYTCECSSFHKTKSRSAHLKTHRQQEREVFLRCAQLVSVWTGQDQEAYRLEVSRGLTNVGKVRIRVRFDLSLQSQSIISYI